MIGWCKDNPGAAIPTYVTGRATIHSWECADGVPDAVRRRFTADAAGYLSEFWYLLDAGSD
jgi:hypothetical protein